MGIGDKNKNCNKIKEIAHYKKYYNNYDFYDKNPEYSDSIKNYFIYDDLTANLQKRVGRIICVDKNSPKYDNQWDFIKVNNGKKIRNSYLDYLFYIKSKIVGMLQVDGINDILETIRKTVQFPKRTFQARHWVTNFIPFMNTSGNIELKNFSENFKRNVIKSTMIETGYIPNSSQVNTKQELVKLAVYKSLSLNTIYHPEAQEKTGMTSIVYTYINNPNLFYNNTPNWIKSYNLNWYYSTTKETTDKKTKKTTKKTFFEIGSFNNAQFIAGVRGGVPYKLKELQIAGIFHADQVQFALIKADQTQTT